MIRTEPFAPARFERENVLETRSGTIPYRTVCEDNVFYDDAGKPIASVFTYSYFRTDVEHPENRPVLFGFNGGPGASSMMVHVGFLGAKRMLYGADADAPCTLPPYTAGDNPDSLLDVADIVLVDPVGTGFGLLLDPAYEDKFFDSEGDAECLLLAVKQWLNRYQRFLSPKYLVGESYGCTRAAVAAGLASSRGADRGYSMAFDGIVFIGNTVTVGNYFNKNIPVESTVLMVPTCAGIHWYYNHPSEQTVEAFVAEARAFADTELLLALYQGDRLQGAARAELVRKLCYYTGVSPEFAEEHGLRFDEWDYRAEFGRRYGVMVSRHDARVTLPTTPMQTMKKRLFMVDFLALDDGIMAKYGPAFDGILQGVLFPSLGIHFERTFVNSYVERWKSLDTKGLNTAEQLYAAMRRCPGMRVFFANGWYDLCTQIGIVYYTLSHAGLDRERAYLKGYPSGHMLYVGEDNCRALCDDVRAFVTGGRPDGAE